jgi:GNAT superfamily N-acetyltransferase
MHPNLNTLNMRSEQVQDFRIRHLVGEETPDELTALVRRAMAPLSRRGEPDPFDGCREGSIGFRLGRAFIARRGRQLLGALVVASPNASGECPVLRDPRVARIRLLAVEPSAQRRGIGTQLLAVSERWCADQGFDDIALDMAADMLELVDRFKARGFEVREQFRRRGTAQRRVVLCKRIQQYATGASPPEQYATHRSAIR